jgi:hypothetical protein
VCIIGLKMFALLPLLIVEVVSYVSIVYTKSAAETLIVAFPAVSRSSIPVPATQGPSRRTRTTTTIEEGHDQDVDRHRYARVRPHSMKRADVHPRHRHDVHTRSQGVPHPLRRRTGLALLHDLQSRR